jgi:glutamine synthetase adenylyltransferase
LEKSPFLTGLLADGRVKPSDLDRNPPADDVDGRLGLPSIQRFRRDFKQRLDDPEEALLSLRGLRVRFLMALAHLDLAAKVKPHQVRSRLRALSETLVWGAWSLAEHSLRQRYVHPITYERRNINPPLAICSPSRLGAGDPYYTTGPAPIFVHSRAAQFAPALGQRDFDLARRSGKQWAPAREYFSKLALRTVNYLALPDAAGRGFGPLDEDARPDDGRRILPGTLVVLYSAFQDHFAASPVRERLSLMRLRFLVGQDQLGRAVEDAAREALVKTAADLGSRLKTGVNAWYRERAQVEGLPSIRGGLLDIERVIRLVQLKHGPQQPELIEPAVIKALDQLAAANLIDREQRSVLLKSHTWLWFVANRMSLLADRSWISLKMLKSPAFAAQMEHRLYLPDAARRTLDAIEAARPVLTDLIRRL